MQKVFMLCQEYNDNGWYNSEHLFTSPEEAYAYLRRAAANIMFNARTWDNAKWQYVHAYKDNGLQFHYCIEIGYTIGHEWHRYDLRVKSATLYDSVSETRPYVQL